jgi:hypothetical protein
MHLRCGQKSVYSVHDRLSHHSTRNHHQLHQVLPQPVQRPTPAQRIRCHHHRYPQQRYYQSQSNRSSWAGCALRTVIHVLLVRMAHSTDQYLEIQLTCPETP